MSCGITIQYKYDFILHYLHASVQIIIINFSNVFSCICQGKTCSLKDTMN